MSRTKILLVLAVVFGGAGPVGAVDGVIEINQAKAIAGGLNGSLVSDPPGFPVIITQPGSYRLTGNLTVPNGNTIAIGVGAVENGVTIDLGGFEIHGPNLVNDNPGCSAAGTGIGISSAASPTVVRNGTVSGMGSDGIQAFGTGSRIEHVVVHHNCGVGLYLGSGGFVLESEAHRSRLQGILVSDMGLVKDSIAYDNMGDGISTYGSGVSILGCVVGRNRGYGITSTLDTGIGHVTFFNNSQGALLGGKNLDCNVINGVTFCP